MNSETATLSLENLNIEIKDRIARVTIDRPKVLNALNELTVRNIHKAFTALRDDPSVGAVILTGAGEKAFVAGADINELAVMTPLQGEASSRLGQAALHEIESLESRSSRRSTVARWRVRAGARVSHALRVRDRQDRASRGRARHHSRLRRHAEPRARGPGRASSWIKTPGSTRPSISHAWEPRAPAGGARRTAQVAGDSSRGPVAVVRCAMDAAIRGRDTWSTVEMESAYFGLLSATPPTCARASRPSPRSEKPTFNGA